MVGIEEVSLATKQGVALLVPPFIALSIVRTFRGSATTPFKLENGSLSLYFLGFGI